MHIDQAMKKHIRAMASLLSEKNYIPVPTPINTNQLLEGKVALIVGGSGGIGMAMAKTFMNSGCKIVIAGTREDKLIECCKKVGGGYPINRFEYS